MMKSHPGSWLDHVLDAGRELMNSALGLTDFHLERIDHAYPDRELSGAYLPIVCENEAVLIGLIGSPEQGRDLALQFLKIVEADDLKETVDVQDALRELLNILGGFLLERTRDEIAIVKVGLPIFVEDNLDLARDQAIRLAYITCGPLNFYLTVLSAEAGSTQSTPAPVEARGMKLEDWLGEALIAGFGVVVEAIRSRHFNFHRIRYELPGEDLAGAYMPLVNAKEAILIGLLATPEDFKKVTRSFMQVEDEAYWPSQDETMDAVKEILNILVGLLRQQLLLADKPSTRTGLPIFTEHGLELGEDHEAACVRLNLQAEDMYLVIIRKKPDESVVMPFV
jgi:hypothetical protein